MLPGIATGSGGHNHHWFDNHQRTAQQVVAKAVPVCLLLQAFSLVEGCSGGLEMEGGRPGQSYGICL